MWFLRVCHHISSGLYLPFAERYPFLVFLCLVLASMPRKVCELNAVRVHLFFFILGIIFDVFLCMAGLLPRYLSWMLYVMFRRGRLLILVGPHSLQMLLFKSPN